MASMEEAAATLYPADPFKVAAAATTAEAPAGQAPVIPAETKPADSAEGDATDNLSTASDQAATLYPEDPFAAADKLGINPSAPMPESPDQLTIEMGEEWEVGDTEELRLAKEGLFAASINQSLLTSLSADYQRHAFEPVTISADECMTQLRGEWGDATDAKMQLARDMVNRAAETWPGVWNVIEQYGTGNDPAVIRKIVARAEQLKRMGKL